MSIILSQDVVKLRSSFRGSCYITRCPFNSAAVFLLIPLGLALESLSESFSFLHTEQRGSSPPSDSLVSAGLNSWPS